MSFPELLNAALAVVSIATLAGLGLLRGTVVNLREQLRDERDLTGSLRERDRENQAKLTQLSRDLDALGRVVTAEAHWTAIGHVLDVHHDEARAHWEAERAILIEVRDLLREGRSNV